MLNKNDMAATVVILSLDAMLEFYDVIGIVKYQEEIQHLFKDIVKSVNHDVMFKNKMVEEFYGYSTYDAIYDMLAAETQKLPVMQAQFLREWMWNAYTGQHCSDVSLSSWSSVLFYWIGRGVNPKGYTEAEYDLITAMMEEYKQELDYFSLLDDEDDTKEEGALTDYDREVHRLYNYNYYDDINSPFIKIRTLHTGYKLRSFVKNSKLLSRSDFPFDKLRLSALELAQTSLAIKGDYLSDIRMIKEFRQEEYRCPEQAG